MQKSSPKPSGQAALDPGVLPAMMERARLLEASSWARDLAFAQIETLARRMRYLLLRAGDAVFLEGDREAFLCLIIWGQISIRKMNTRRANRLITRIGPGQALGEMSLIDGCPRSASALAEEDSLVFLLTKEEFNALMQETPQLALKLMLKISRMMSLRLRKTSAELAEHLEASGEKTQYPISNIQYPFVDSDSWIVVRVC